MTTLVLRRHRVWLQILIWGLALLLLSWTLRHVPMMDVLDALGRVPLHLLGVLLTLNLLILWCFGGRGWVILRGAGYRIPYRDQVVYRLAAFSVNYFTPGPQFGGEPLHIYLLVHRHRIPWETALTAVAVDRLIEWLVNMSFLLLGTGVLIGLNMLPASGRGPLLGGIVLLAGVPLGYLILLARGRRPLTALLQRWDTHMPSFVSAFGERLQAAENQAGRLYHTQPRALIVAVLISLVTWALLIGEYALMLRALGLRLPFLHILAVMTAARWAFLVPTPGGLGALESSQVLALTALGYGPSAGLSVSLLIRGRDILVGVLGFILTGMLLKGITKSSWSPDPNITEIQRSST